MNQLPLLVTELASGSPFCRSFFFYPKDATVAAKPTQNKKLIPMLMPAVYVYLLSNNILQQKTENIFRITGLPFFFLLKRLKKQIWQKKCLNGRYWYHKEAEICEESLFYAEIFHFCWETIIRAFSIGEMKNVDVTLQEKRDRLAYWSQLVAHNNQRTKMP